MNNLTLRDQMQLALYRPDTMQEVALQYLEDNFNGKIRVVDPINPFMSLLETTIACASAASDHMLLSQSKRFAVLATNEDELYPHMNIGDVTERFAQPSQSTFTVRVNYDAIVRHAIASPDNLYRFVRIPRDTYVTVGDMTFTLTHAIELRLYDNRLKLVYLTDGFDEMHVLDDNVIPYRTIQDSMRYKWIFFDIPLKEHTRKFVTYEVSPSSPFEHILTDYAKFHRLLAEHFINGAWQPLNINHTFGKFNPDNAELHIEVTSSELRVRVLPIYQTNGLMGSQIRLTLIGTNGDVQVDFSSYPDNLFKTVLFHAERELDAYEKAFDKTSFMITSKSSTANGREALNFKQLKELHLTNSFGQPNTPITDRNLSHFVAKTGNVLTKWSNTVSGRQYISSSSQPINTEYLPVTGIPVSYTAITGNFNTLSQSSHSIRSDDGNRCVLLPSAVYGMDQFASTVLDDLTISDWETLTDVELNVALNAADYRYSPWIHVLTADGPNMTISTYDKDNSGFSNKSFAAHNATTSMYLTSLSQSAEFDEDDFSKVSVKIILQPDPSHDQVPNSDLYFQLSFIGLSGERRYITSNNATIDPLTNELVLNLDIMMLSALTSGAGMDIVDGEWLRVSNALSLSGDPVVDHMPISGNVWVTYCSTSLPNPSAFIADEINNTVMQEDLVSYRYGIAIEEFDLHLLEELKHLYTTIQPTGSERLYERATADIYAKHTENVLAPYHFGANDEHVLPFKLDGNCNIERIYEHYVGDFIIRPTINHTVNATELTSEVIKVNDIVERDALEVTIGTVAYVRDVSDDVSVIDSLFAFYIYMGIDAITNTGVWVRDTEYHKYLYKQYSIGDLILDSDGNPIPLSISHYNHRLYLMTLPVAYKYATEESTVLQRQYLLNNIIREATDETRLVYSDLLENSTIHYKPTVSLGLVKVSTGTDNVKWMNAEVSGKIIIRCEESLIDSAESIKTIKEVTLRTLDSGLKATQINRHKITEDILAAFVTGVYSISLDLDVFDNDEVFNIVDKSESFSIRKKLAIHPTLKRYLEEDIEFTFIAL